MEDEKLEKLFNENPPKTLISDIGRLKPTLELFLDANREGRLAGTWGKKMYLSRIESIYETIYSVYW